MVAAPSKIQVRAWLCWHMQTRPPWYWEYLASCRVTVESQLSVTTPIARWKYHVRDGEDRRLGCREYVNMKVRMKMRCWNQIRLRDETQALGAFVGYTLTKLSLIHI